MNQQPISDYWTHQAPLIAAVMQTTGPVLEIGAGNFSTPLLHEICRAQQRLLCTMEKNETWLKWFEDLRTPLHEVANNWQSGWRDRDDWSVVFVDGERLERQLYIKHYARSTNLLVVHDVECARLYRYDFTMYDYACIYRRYAKLTGIFSNYTDVSSWFPPCNVAS